MGLGAPSSWPPTAGAAPAPPLETAGAAPAAATAAATPASTSEQQLVKVPPQSHFFSLAPSLALALQEGGNADAAAVVPQEEEAKPHLPRDDDS
ncbi:hypothetical protein HU200_001056 [Digitaria exilis]|uniref:Uncharacterized protein n=1 Tax=Digitaria exilis TaxID=1010633 RepID=A0A835FYA5_9POAL|nr:hypothetical protein HU200_001056 [Digitaria exilis]